MKRGGPIPRRTPLTASTPLHRTGGLSRARTPRTRPQRTTEERRARRLVAARSGGRCEINPRDPATDWSHRWAKGRCGPWSASNGIATCRRHHTEAHDRPARSYALGWHVRTGHNPATVPVRLAAGWVLLGDDGSVSPTSEAAA